MESNNVKQNNIKRLRSILSDANKIVTGIENEMCGTNEAIMEYQKTKSKQFDEMVSLLRECEQDYNNPHFTDRHGTGKRISELLKKLNP